MLFKRNANGDKAAENVMAVILIIAFCAWRLTTVGVIIFINTHWLALVTASSAAALLPATMILLSIFFPVVALGISAGAIFGLATGLLTTTAYLLVGVLIVYGVGAPLAIAVSLITSKIGKSSSDIASLSDGPQSTIGKVLHGLKSIPVSSLNFCALPIYYPFHFFCYC